MREFADTVGLKHANNNPDKAPEDVLKYVESQVKRAFPEKFTNPKRSQPSLVEGGAPLGKSLKVDDIELSDEERKAMLTFERAGIMTKEEYKKQLRAVRGS